jgi:hypothetical protein
VPKLNRGRGDIAGVVVKWALLVFPAVIAVVFVFAVVVVVVIMVALVVAFETVVIVVAEV